MTDPMYQLLLTQLARTFRERALEAHREAQLTKAQGGDKHQADYESGRALAYYEVMSTFVNQAQGLDIPLDAVGLQGFDPDKELLSAH
jgi:hypothetical protein